MANETAGKSEHERQEAEFRLRERERFLRMLISNLPGAVFRCRADALFTKEFISDGCFDLTGYHAVELVGVNAVTSWNDLIHAEDRESVFAELRRLIENEQQLDGDQLQISYRLICRDEQVRHISDRFRFVRDSAGRVAALEGFSTDVTASRRAEEHLRSSEMRYRTLFDSIDEGFCVIEMIFDRQGKPCDWRYLEVNPAFEKNTGFVEATGKTILQLTPDIEPKFFEIYGAVATTGEPIRLIEQSKALNSWFDLYAFRVDDESRKVAVIFSDITGRKQTQDALRDSEELFRAFVTTSSEVVYWMNADWSEMRQLHGREFIADTNEPSRDWLQAYIYPDDQSQVQAAINQAVRAKSMFELEHRVLRVDGSLGWAFLRAIPLLDAKGEIVQWFGAVSDITKRKQAEEALRASENRYRLLAENMHDLVCLHDLDGKYLYVSPSSETLLGYAPAELVGTSPYNLFHPDDVERWRDEVHAPLTNGEIGAIVIEYRMRDKKGEYCWLETMAQTFTDTSGVIVQIQTVSRDISSRKKAEAKTLEAQEELAHLLLDEQESRRDADHARVEAEHANRAKDEFLQMVSHEFRTPLTTIKTLVRVLQHDGNSESARQKHLETIAAECDRQIDMILNLLDVSRLEEGDADLKNEPTDINRVLYSCDKIERPAAEAREQTFTVEQNASLPKVAGDEKAIRRALCTIIENAIKYTPEGGMITVTARHVAHHGIESDNAEKDKKIAAEMFGDLPQQMDFSTDEQLTGEEVAVIICDTGRGILPEDLPKLFGKFYRGKKPHHDSATDGTPDDAAGKAETPGVGLGLYLAKRLINAHNGRITINSEVGRGSCFTVFLPIWKENMHEKDTLDEYGFDEEYAEKTPAGG